MKKKCISTATLSVLLLVLFLPVFYYIVFYGTNMNYNEMHKIIQPNIEKEQQTPKIQYFRGFLYILKIYQTPSKHTKMFR